MRPGSTFGLTLSALALFLLLLPISWSAAGLALSNYPDLLRVLLDSPWPGEGVRVISLLGAHLAAGGYLLLLLLGGLGGARWLGPQGEGWGGRVEAALLSWGALGGLSFLLFFARLGFLVAPLTLTALAVLSCGNLPRPRKPHAPQPRTRPMRPAGFYEWTLVLIIVVSALLALLSAPMPVHQSDALAYHALVPRACVEAGRLPDFPYNIRAHFPMLAGMLSAPGLALGIESAPRLLHVAFFLAGLALAADLAAGWAGRRAGLWAAAALATVAYAPSLAAYSFVDFAALAFFLAALRRLGRLADDKGPAPHHLLRLALLCGMAAATKLSIALSLLPLLIAGAVLALRRSARRSLRALALAAALGLLPLSPWWAYNGVTLGNPFAPFLSSLFPSPYWTPADAAIYAAHAAEKGGLARGWTTDLAVLPYRAATAPMRDHPSVAAHPERWLGDWPVGPLALAGLPLLVLLILPGAPRRMRWAALLWLWLYLAWAASYRDLRFLLPFLAVQAALLGALLEWGAGDRRAARALTLPMLAGQTAMALLLALRVTAAPTPAGRAPLGYVLGFTSRQQFLADKIPDNFTPALDWLRRHPRPGERTLIVGLNHGYYLPRECILGDFFSTSPLLAWAREAGSVSGLEARLSREGVTRVVFVGENLCHPAYQYWFFLHALPEETARQALRNRTSGTYGTDSEAYRILAAWKTASRRWVRVYPEGGPELENGPGPWGLPPTTLIYSTQPDSSAEPIDNTSLRRQSPG